MKPPARKRASVVAYVSPASDGWRVSLPPADAPDDPVPATVHYIPDLSEAADAARASGADRLRLALPGDAAFLVRLALPSADPSELGEMVRLQLEKTMPYPPEEVTAGHLDLGGSGGETEVLAVAARNDDTQALCQPLLDKGYTPERLTLFAADLAATTGPGNHLLIYREQGRIAIVIARNGGLAFAQSASAGDAPAFAADLTHLLLAAEMEGAPSAFDSLLIEPTCGGLAPTAGRIVNLEPATLNTELATGRSPLDLAPPAWAADAARRARFRRATRIAAAVAAAYVVALLGAAVYLGVLSARAAGLDRQLAELRPQIEQLQAQQARWSELAPAVDPAFYTVEILFQIFQCRPSENTTITTFDQTAGQFMLEGEAATAAEAIDFVERIKGNAGLSAFTIESGPPNLLPGDRAGFRIFGKQ